MADSPRKIREYDAVPGDIIQTAQGNRYLLIEDGSQVYLGNQNPAWTDHAAFEQSVPYLEVTVVGRFEFFRTLPGPPPAPLPVLDKPFHDHGDWKGPCSPERHALIMAGGPPDRKESPPRSAAERARFTLGSCRLFDGNLCCACCRAVLLDDSDSLQLEGIIDLLKAVGYPDKRVHQLGLRHLVRITEEMGGYDG